MEALELARWQFGITTVYHFILVPLTIGLATLVAIMQTAAYRTGNPKWQKVTDFFGKILLINFALGVATGIVQEFQFGMNWSEYSRYVGDIFGAPLAFEALLAFFLESTFLGLWIFGKGRLSPKVHTLTIWLFALGSAVSAFFILAANSFMQYPEGAIVNPETGRAELDGMGGFLKVLFSTTSLLTFAHTISAAFLISGTLVAALSIWWMARSVRISGNEEEARTYWKPAARIGLVSVLIASIGLIGSGHIMGQHVVEIQPAKAAAMMGVCESGEAHELTLIMDTRSCDGAQLVLPIPGVESFMATNHFSGEASFLQGLDDVNAELQEKYADVFGPDQDYRPNLTVTFYSFRIMVGIGFLFFGLSLLGFWYLRGSRINRSEKVGLFANFMIPIPFIASSTGWLLTEMGRQPWVVNPGQNDVMLLTNLGVSGNVSAFSIVLSMGLFTLLYTALGVVWFLLIRRYALEGINTKKKVVEYDSNVDAPMSFVY
ncbi:cytochrome ubiquinol oxidase subunit I [Changpingibacter yushuensis]|uniref:cytochrome ubiquinol oxidase subunit I n=1 Tax=Changpingibacter yushuensis TaxID=2758440 RepID=UPI0015F5A632|nr:cytochrome ubiquinol oxidase subunit I [Changpingibacter yushuensis]